MFQYAFGRSLSTYYETELKLDISFFRKQLDKTVDYRHFTLDDFQIKASIASDNEIDYLTNRTYFKTVDSILNKFIGRKPSFLYHVEPSYIYWYKEIPQNSYLEGYFQSYRYFQNIRNVLLNDFIPKHPPLKSLLQNQQNTSVSIHIRRGDYINNTIHPLCDIKYYSEAIDFIKESISGPIHWNLFSDDEQWIHSEFLKKVSLEVYTIVISDQQHPVNDLYLMSQCQHNIIANSTFSWWAAWLNNNTNKIVIAPQKWSNNPHWNNDNLIPNEWVLI